MKHLSDSQARLEALNPASSYIVQAPAGSGKTELLTQRILKLLTTVENPESIIALTFTKKAAQEMRDRILLALEKTSNNEKNAQSKTDELAEQVLIHDKKNHWQLLQLPNRLNIQTIDALCSSLVAKMPILTQGVPFTTITKDPDQLYQKAARRCLKEGEKNTLYQQATQTLLLHVGNHYNHAIQLLANMLSWREQWLPHLVPAQNLSTEILRQQLENALSHITEELENELEHIFPNELKKELSALIDFSESNLAKNETITHRTFWKKVTHILLTQENNWRVRIDKKLGFPSPAESKNSTEKAYLKSMKMRLEALLCSFRENTHSSEKYRLILENYHHCPPKYYSDNQWEILLALITLLPLLAAELKTLFTETGETDFSEISEQASLALGELDNPSELALHLDYTIQHVLIDEFQDTSLKQFYLLEKLIEGWQPNDGRTLFIVGDPMQSIYRFREADVSLFLQARQSGLGSVALKSLTLNSNFRSRPELIEWVNVCFQSIFPPQDNMQLSAITHHISQAGRPVYPSAGKIQSYHNATAEEQASHIVNIIQTIPKEESIGLLVRSRAQLKKILPQLQIAGISFQGVDIDLLSTRPHIQDLCYLTQTLLQPTNQLAWFSTLRAPWCGLTLSDCLTLKRGLDNELTLDGQMRFNHTLKIITKARQQRQRLALSAWVEHTWKELGGYLIVHEKDQPDIERFWDLLDEYNDEDLDISHNLFKKLSKLYSNTAQKSQLHVMTIHKSKGLEFDHIILPHLEANHQKTDTPLLQHMERRSQLNNQNELILATVKSIENQQDEIYQYLHFINNKKEIFERQRLLYVALTRARIQIHLFSVQAPEREATNNSFLKWLEPFLPSPSTQFISTTSPEHHLKKSSLTCLKNSFYTENNTLVQTQHAFQSHSRQPIKSSLIQITGTFIHEQIQYCAENHLTKSSYLIHLTQKNHPLFWKSRLLELGVYHTKDQEYVINATYLALKNIYHDPRGQWILHSHTSASNEYSLSDSLRHFIIDRTFIDSTTSPHNPCRWIIDYKISQENFPTGDLSAEFAPKQYRVQLEEYGKLFHETEQIQIFLGLYYPITKTWIAWPYILC